MSIRSAYILWPQALGEAERLLSNLSKFTRVNTLELGLYYATSGVAGGSIPAGPRQKSVISDAEAFEGLRIPAVSKSELASMRQFMERARSSRFKIACNFSPLYVPTRERMSMACVDITGATLNPPLSPPQALIRPVAVYGCPNNPDVARFSETMIRQIVTSWAPSDIITINHVEFPMWPGRRKNGFMIEDLFSCFCGSCEQKAKEEGIDFAQVKDDVMSLYKTLATRRAERFGLRTDISSADVLNILANKPSLATWLHFRSHSMTEYVKGVVRVGKQASREHDPHLQFGLEFQLPALSNLLGTNFVELSQYFDFMVPKFPDYIVANTIPIISKTIASRTGKGDAADIGRAIREMLDLGPGPRKFRRRAKSRNVLYEDAFDTSMIERQMKHLAPVLGKIPLCPYMWLEGEDASPLGEKIKALKKNGFDGYFLWLSEADLSTEVLKSRKGTF